MLLSSFSNHQTKLYGKVYAVLTMREYASTTGRRAALYVP
jgi:hypothetical protein